MDQGTHAGLSALVTGGASGIGRATALHLARSGAQVTACDIDAAGLELLARLLGRDGPEIRIIVTDVGQQADGDRAVDLACAGTGTVDALANVAGLMDHYLQAHELDDDTWRRVMTVNLDGPMRLCRAVLPPMVRIGGGRTVNSTSAPTRVRPVAGRGWPTHRPSTR